MNADRRPAALVTGAAGGIGAAIVAALTADGFDVLAVDLRPSQKGPGAGFAADLTTREGNRAAVEHALDRFGRLDAIVGMQHVAPVKTLALEGAEQGITATAVCPGFVRTPLVEAQIGDQARVRGMSEDDVLRDVILAPHAVKRLLEPSEVAATVAFLLGPAGRAFTGVPVTMDLGWTAR